METELIIKPKQPHVDLDYIAGTSARTGDPVTIPMSPKVLWEIRRAMFKTPYIMHLYWENVVGYPEAQIAEYAPLKAWRHVNTFVYCSRTVYMYKKD